MTLYEAYREALLSQDGPATFREEPEITADAQSSTQGRHVRNYLLTGLYASITKATRLTLTGHTKTSARSARNGPDSPLDDLSRLGAAVSCGFFNVLIVNPANPAKNVADVWLKPAPSRAC